MEFVNPGAKHGLTNGVPTCTKQGVVIFGGHSGMGMLQASELARSQMVDHVMTVSKRGKPMAPGASSAFISVISECSTHYMAACDEGDQKAVECLLDWAPPVAPTDMPADEAGETGFEEVITQTRMEMDSMTPAQAGRSLEALKDLRDKMLFSIREVKARLQHKSFEKEKAQLQEQLLQLQEQEASVMELLAELTAKASVKPAAAITG
mmetsp:Transcript_69303/g.157232  ORF Transcript_69303/g.157232 Transcript_69303/m.157232 type:complete len:208 (+) Transcript_69303:79-702(+)